MDFPARLPIPDTVLKIAKQLEGAGYETWCVGGAIRDNLLKVENHDFDLTTAAPPAEVRRLFKRTVPVGIEHAGAAAWRVREADLECRRALRYSARLEFGTKPRTLEPGRAKVQGLGPRSAERVRAEWFKGSAPPKRVPKLDPELEPGAEPQRPQD